ncbi:MAG: P1 family peptidase [Acidimicrobiia bacterium]
MLNGAGELTGALQAQEWGSLETPVLLTRTMAVGRVFDGVVEVMLAADAAVGSEGVVIPAIADARGADAGPVAEGSVGAGTGMVCLGFKGGIGSASREVPPTGYRLGALVLANFGDGASLTVDGVPVGRDFVAEGWKAARDEPEGSCIVVLATDAPLSSRQLQRLATRAGLGLARTGSVAHHSSGEIFLAFSTGARMSRTPETNILHRNLLRDEVLNPFFAAAVEATEEAVVNCLVAADTVSGRDGHVATGIPLDRLTSIMRRHGRLN